MDLAVINGQVYREGRFESAHLYIKEGKIAEISSERLKADSVYDARGKWVLPGLIDPHVHLQLRVGKTVSRDDFDTGSVLAAYGGVTTLIDFLDPAGSLEEMKLAFEQRKSEARSCHVDYSFHTTIKGFEGSLEDLARFAVSQGMPSVKMFTTYRSTGRQTSDRLITELFRQSAASRFTLLIHTENDALIDESPGAPFALHGQRRPPLSEISEVLKLAGICEYTGGYGYIVHTNCGTTLEKLKEGFSGLLKSGHLLIESCPHYFQFNSDLYQSAHGYRYVLTPPLRPQKEQEKLKARLDCITTIGTDHCPYTEEEKNHSSLDDIPNGIEGMPYTLPVLFKHFGKEILPKMTHDCARAHGLYPRKGTLKVGSDGDLVIFDPEKEVRFDEKRPWHRALKRDGSVSPYYNIRGKGEVCATFVRGEAVMMQGQFHNHQGRFIQRSPR